MFLNGQPDFLTKATAGSTRAVGDALQEIVGQDFQRILGDICDFARRAMADIAFTDKAGIYYVVDVKTHRADTKFNMPNLISVDRLSRFYETDNNYFIILFISYAMEGTHLKVSEVRFMPIEFFSWECLTIGALGWGQIQIANSNRIVLRPQYSRKSWMVEMCDELLSFYPSEIAKIEKRIGRFQSLREIWANRADVWTAQPLEPPKVIETSNKDTKI
jgi:hypothetical protein